MKISVLCATFFIFMGCSYDMQTYVDEPRTLFVDPLTVENTKALDTLEEAYLKKEISYDEYLKKKAMLEEDYAREVQKREKRIENY